MGSPYLSNNETIQLSTHNLVINTIPAEAILTSNRLMLIDYSHPQILPQDIPFGAIETVTIGDNSAKEPVLSLSVAAPDGARHTIGMVFTQPARTKRSAERDAWAAKLKEMSMAAMQEHGVKSADLLPPWVPGEIPAADGKEQEKPAQSENVYRPLKPAQKRNRPASPGKSRAVTIGAVLVIIIVAVVIGSWFLAPSIWGKTAGPSVQVPTPTSTPVVTATPTAAPVQTSLPATVATTVPTVSVSAAVTPVPTAAPLVKIPQTGVWVHVIYDGKFTGTVGTSGGLKDITGSTEGFYQIPVAQGMLMATVQKQDNSGNVLTVEFYKDGTLLKSSTMKTPKGTLEAQVEIPTSVPTTIAGNVTA